MLFPNMQITRTPSEARVIEFKGYDTQNQIADGAMRDMKNLCSDDYPALTQRKQRGLYSDKYENPTAILARREKLAVCDATSFYYDGEKKFDFPQEYAGERQLQAINTRIVIFPDKMYYNTETGDYGYLSNEVHPTQVSFHHDPVTYETTATFTMPQGATLTGFKKGDTISFSGLNPAIIGYKTKEDNNIENAIIEKIDYEHNQIIFAEGVINYPTEDYQDFTDTGYSGQGFTMERNIPDMDFILEYSNRLYGCKGNMIYVSKLGDPTNWWFFGTGTAESSYQVEVGTDGDFTGIAPFSSHICFFKENCIHKLYGYKPANYQLITTNCLGLEKGSHKSVQLINGTIFYKSREGIMVYTGDTPSIISHNFGKTRYDSAVSGTDNLKYYVSMRNKEDGKWYLFVYDIEKGLWHLEDNTHASDFAYVGTELVYADADRDDLMTVTGSGNNIETEPIEWYARFGDFDEYIESKKVYSKINMRLTMEPNSKVDVWISVDGGKWQCIKHIETNFKRAVEMPIVPARCDKFGVLITGTGYTRIESMTRLVREGTMR